MKGAKASVLSRPAMVGGDEKQNLWGHILFKNYKQRDKNKTFNGIQYKIRLE